MKMNKKGFTLVELMVVLAILGLLAGIGIPSYMNVLERARVGTDIASIAQVQTSVNAFIAEIGGWNQSTVATLAAAPANDDTAATVSTAITGTSIVTGGTINLSGFFDENTLPLLKSDDGAGKAWFINDEGRVFVATFTAGVGADPGTYSNVLPPTVTP